MSLRTPPHTVHGLVAASRELIGAHQAPSGAFPASPSYPVYQYSWFRDGAFIAEGLSRHGDVAAADAFHQWCADLILSRKGVVADIVRRLQAGDTVPREDFLPTRYTLDGRDGAEAWWDFQTDGYGTWLWSLGQHLRRHGQDPARFSAAVSVIVNYLQHVWRQPCYDWWEEHPDQRHVSTMGAVAAGFDAALDLQVLDARMSDAVARQRHDLGDALRIAVAGGALVKWLGSTAVDGSLLACVAPFGLLDEGTARITVAAVEKDLVEDHGVYRYLGDTFYGGGRWPVLAAFHGLALAHLGRTEDARASLEWIASTAGADCGLPEQVGPPLLHPERETEWIKRWGPVANPLLWSHGMYLILADELGVRA